VSRLLRIIHSLNFKLNNKTVTLYTIKSSTLQQMVLWEHFLTATEGLTDKALDHSNTLEKPLLANSSPPASLWELQINHRLDSHTYTSKKLKGKSDKLYTTKMLYNQGSNDSKRTLICSVTTPKNLILLLGILLRKFPSTVWNIFSHF